MQTDEIPERVYIAHLSDSHIQTSSSSIGDTNFRLKKLQYFCNPMKGRYCSKILGHVLEHLDVRHLCFTGDLTNSGISKEYVEVRDIFLKKFIRRKKKEFKCNEADLLTLVPGNHDLSIASDFSAFRPGVYFKKSFGQENPRITMFPYIKATWHLGFMIISINSCVPQSPFIEYGDIAKQLILVRRLLRKFIKKTPAAGKLFKIIMMHHSPVRRFSTKLLDNMYNLSRVEMDSMIKVVKEFGINLIMCGHLHHFDVQQLPGTSCLVVDSGVCSHRDKNTHAVYCINTKKNTVESIEKRSWNEETGSIESSLLESIYSCT